MQAVQQVDSLWGLAAMIVITGGSVVTAWLTNRTKKATAQKDVKVEPVIEKAEQVINLQPAVDALTTQMSAVQAELAVLRPIASTKYPIALNHISAFHQLFPGSGLDIPDQIKDDL